MSDINVINTENNIQHFLHLLNLYAKSKGWILSNYANNIVKRCIEKCDGHCPCDYERGFCPCNEHENEIETNGMCHCTLFIKATTQSSQT